MMLFITSLTTQFAEVKLINLFVKTQTISVRRESLWSGKFAMRKHCTQYA